MENCYDYFNYSISYNYLDCSNKMIVYDSLLNEINDNNIKLSITRRLQPLLLYIEELNNKILKLDISHNILLDEGLYLLAQTLQNNSKLIFLSVAYNEVSSQGIYNFLIKIFTFPNIPYIDIRGNFGSNLRCIKKVLNKLNFYQKIEFQKKIIWKGNNYFTQK